MKQCPTCNLTYDDSSAFCAQDATPLISVEAAQANPAPGAPQRNSRALRYSMIGCGVLFLAGLASCGALIMLATKPDPEARKKIEEQNRGDMLMVIQRLSTLRANYPELATLKEATCSDDEIGKLTQSMGDGKETYYRRARYVDYDFLEQFSNPAADPEGAALRGWQFMTEETMLDYRPIDKLKLSLSARETASRMYDERTSKRFVLVFRAAKRQLPSLSETADVFNPGFFDGWAVVFDYQTGHRLCQTPLQFESGESVSYKSKSRFFSSPADKESMAKSVQEDFKKQFKQSAKKALARVSGKLEIFGDL